MFSHVVSRKEWSISPGNGKLRVIAAITQPSPWGVAIFRYHNAASVPHGNGLFDPEAQVVQATPCTSERRNSTNTRNFSGK